MARIFDARLADYADDLLNIIGTHEELLREFEEKRLEFNAAYKKIFQKKIKPAIQNLLDRAYSRGHWVETSTDAEEQYREYIHQTYTFSWKTGGYCTLTVVAKYDYNKVFFILTELPDSTVQQGLALDKIQVAPLTEWLISALPPL